MLAGGIADVVGDTASRPPEQIDPCRLFTPAGSDVTIGSQMSQHDSVDGKVVLLVISNANAPGGVGRRSDGGGVAVVGCAGCPERVEGFAVHLKIGRSLLAVDPSPSAIRR